jgi:hypothetical protein
MKKNKKTVLLITGAVLSVGVFASLGTAYAIDAMNVVAPMFPALGQVTATSCDTNGVTTAYTYGNTSSNGVKVTSITVSGIDSSCKTTQVEFILNDVVAATYTGPVATNATTITTNIFTGQFSTVRVTLNP